MKLIDRLPKSYKELNYKPYVAIINQIPSEKPANLSVIEWSKLIHLTTLGLILGVSQAEIENLPAREVLELIGAIGYLEKPIEKGPCKYKVKGFNELKYDEFVQYQSLRLDQWNNIPDILLLVCKDITPAEVDNMSIYEAMQVFFCLKRLTRTYITRLKYWTLAKLLIQTVYQLPRRLSRRRKTSSAPVGVGSI